MTKTSTLAASSIANPLLQGGAAVSGAVSAPSVAAGGGLFGLALATSQFGAVLGFLETQGDVQTLSSPRDATLNNQKAVLKVGTDQPYVTSITVAPGSISAGTVIPTSVSPQISNIFSGISLDVTPQIDDSGNISLHIHPLVTSVATKAVGFNLAGVGAQSVDVAAINVSESDTMVRTQDGRIVVLGGLMKVELGNGRSGIPGLSDAPGIGGAFRNSSTDTVKRELVILIKPSIIENDKYWDQDLQDTRNRMRQMRTDKRTGAADGKQ